MGTQTLPLLPPGREEIITEYAGLKYGSRPGRLAVMCLDEKIISLAVIAHIRHVETSYDSLLAQGYDYREVRAQVAEVVERILTAWQRQDDISRQVEFLIKK